MLTQKLHSALLLLNPDMPFTITAREAWERHLNPDKNVFARNTFWWALSRSLPFAKSEIRQNAIADFIEINYRRAMEQKKMFPPTRLTI